MTREEAIKELEILKVFDAPDLNDAIKMAISALRKQEQAFECTQYEECEYNGNPVCRLPEKENCPHGLKVVEIDQVKPMTNADRIDAMTIEEKADFLSSIAYAGETPWCKPFAEEFCKSCPTTTCTAEGYSNPMDLHECDFTDGKCPHGSDIVWWLQQPVKEDDHAL